MLYQIKDISAGPNEIAYVELCRENNDYKFRKFASYKASGSTPVFVSEIPQVVVSDPSLIEKVNNLLASYKKTALAQHQTTLITPPPGTSFKYVGIGITDVEVALGADGKWNSVKSSKDYELNVNFDLVKQSI